jgi:XRE family transcriptional regulator, regulator of sulfur utilization
MDKRFKPLTPAQQLDERVKLFDDLHTRSLAGELSGVAGVGAAVRMVRDRLHLTIADMAKVSGVAARSITQIESGTGNPTLATIEALFKPLGLKISVTTGLTTAPPPNLSAHQTRA